MLEAGNKNLVNAKRGNFNEYYSLNKYKGWEIIVESKLP